MMLSIVAIVNIRVIVEVGQNVYAARSIMVLAWVMQLLVAKHLL